MGDEEMEDRPATPASEELRIADRPPGPWVPALVAALVASALGIVFGLLIDWFPVTASTQIDTIVTFYDVLMIASVPVFTLVTAVVIYCVWRFKMRPGEENMDGPPIHGNTRLEVIWTAIPAIMMVGLCIYAAVELSRAEEAPANQAEELHVRVVGEQFTWTFFYENPDDPEKEIASNQLYLPIDESVRFHVQTKDVLHDFWVPSFAWKVDAVPGLTTRYRVTPNRLGRYPVVCAELCGLGHAVMRQWANVMPADEFDAWLDEQASGGGATVGSPEQGPGAEETGGGEGTGPDGEALFSSNGCGGCHVLEAAGAQGATGPSLDEVLPDKDTAYIRESIVDPEADIAEGYNGGIMPPNYGDVMSPEEIDALVTYLEESTKG